MLKRWSTSDVPPWMARDYWLTLLRDQIFHGELDMPRESSVEASLLQADCGPLRMSWVDSAVSRMLLRGAAAEQGAADGDVLLMVMDSPSEWTLRGGRDGFALGPGDLVCADFRAGFEMLRPGRARTLSVSLSAPWLRGWVPDARFDSPRVLRAESGWSAVLSLMLRQIQPERLDMLSAQRELLATQLGSLLALVLRQQVPGRTLDAGSLGGLVQACVQRNFGRFGLTSAEVAAELGVSERSLHRALARDGMSFAERLHAQRMAVARRLLGDRHFAALSVAEIGRRVGYADASHFVRRFKSEYAMTPGAMRRKLRYDDSA
jgi:AraC-like DNA-binding protein